MREVFDCHAASKMDCDQEADVQQEWMRKLAAVEQTIRQTMLACYASGRTAGRAGFIPPAWVGVFETNICQTGEDMHMFRKQALEVISQSAGDVPVERRSGKTAVRAPGFGARRDSEIKAPKAAATNVLDCISDTAGDVPLEGALANTRVWLGSRNRTKPESVDRAAATVPHRTRRVSVDEVRPAAQLAAA